LHLRFAPHGKLGPRRRTARNRRPAGRLRPHRRPDSCDARPAAGARIPLRPRRLPHRFQRRAGRIEAPARGPGRFHPRRAALSPAPHAFQRRAIARPRGGAAAEARLVHAHLPRSGPQGNERAPAGKCAARLRWAAIRGDGLMPLAVARSPQEWLAQFGNSGRRAALTIGNFDGVHLGHQAILRRVRESARESGALAAILTFYPHPARVLRPASAPVLLMTLEQRLTAIESLGLDAALVLTFDAPLAHMTAQDFAQRLLVRTMRAAAVCVGENFRFGHRKAGDVALLRALGRENGFAVVAVPPVEIEGLIVSSTAI